MQGYTVENLIGPQVFINLIRRIFIEEGLLKDSVNELVASVAEHLRHVVQHVVALHAKVHPVLSNRLASTARGRHRRDDVEGEEPLREPGRGTGRDLHDERQLHGAALEVPPLLVPGGGRRPEEHR